MKLDDPLATARHTENSGDLTQNIECIIEEVDEERGKITSCKTRCRITKEMYQYRFVLANEDASLVKTSITMNKTKRR